MSFGTAISTCFHKYADFNGRAARSEFWWWQLFCVIVVYVPLVIGMFLVLAASAGSSNGELAGAPFAIGIVFYGIAFIVSLALFVPTIAVGCRRLHDRGTSGWLQLLMLVPCGNIVLFIYWLLAGTPGDNQYGPVPGSEQPAISA